MTRSCAARSVRNFLFSRASVARRLSSLSRSSLSLAIATGALAFLTLVAKRFLSARFGLMAIYFCLLVSIIAGASITYTANLGGQIRHSEIRASQAGDRNVPAQRREAKVDDDD